jgi:hypothetical protein
VTAGQILVGFGVLMTLAFGLIYIAAEGKPPTDTYAYTGRRISRIMVWVGAACIASGATVILIAWLLSR